MYKIIGADEKEYGPISADQLRQWISEGRINANTKIQAEGSGVWKRVGEMPEFAAVLPVIPPPLHTAPISMAPPPAKANATATWAMVIGIISFIPCCWGIPILGVAAVVLGCIALSQLKKNPQQTGSGFAIAGLVMGILSLIFAAIGYFVVLSSPQFLINIQNALRP